MTRRWKHWERALNTLLLSALLGLPGNPGLHAQIDRPELVGEQVLAPEELPRSPDFRSDPRFFGEYCQAEPIKICKDVAFGLFRTCASLTEVRVRVDYYDAGGALPRGVIKGGGSFRLDGERGAVCVAGAVVARGTATVSGSVPGLGSAKGATATLSNTGVNLQVSALGRSVNLSKDACGNEPPSVHWMAPHDGQNFPRGLPITLVTKASDDHDADFPVSRLQIHSHRDGFLPGGVADGDGATGNGLLLRTAALSVGQHALTFLATDSGGLTNGRSISITIEDRPAEPGEIGIAPPD